MTNVEKINFETLNSLKHPATPKFYTSFNPVEFIKKIKEYKFQMVALVN